MNTKVKDLKSSLENIKKKKNNFEDVTTSVVPVFFFKITRRQMSNLCQFFDTMEHWTKTIFLL